MGKLVRMNFRGLLRASVALGAMAAAAAVGQAAAAEGAVGNGAGAASAESVAELVVIGTNIRGKVPPTSKITTIDREEIERSGFIDIGQAIRSLPGASGGGINPEARFASGNLDNAAANLSGISSANLLGLGSGATLTLLNGHRLPAGSEGIAVDLSLIPLVAVDRIEVLSDGASAIYGADAVAGVVNLVTRRDFDGVESRVRYGKAEGGLGTFTGSVLAGGTIGRFSGLIGGEYFDQDKLSASKRVRSSALPVPNNLVGDSNRSSLVATGKFEVSDRVKVYGDALYMQRFLDSLATRSGYTDSDDLKVNQYAASAGIEFELSKSWALVVEGTANENRYKDMYTSVRLNPLAVAPTTFSTRTNKLRSIEMRLNGTLFELPAGPVGSAFGIVYREESQDATRSRLSERTVKSAYGELNIPLVGDANKLSLVDSLQLHLAVRHDDYSDFGGVSVPKIGFAWQVYPSLKFRGNFSESFRAPSAYERLGSYGVDGNATAKDGAGTSRILYACCLSGDLGPERSKNYSLGATYTPGWLDGLKLALDWYRIHYSDRIASPDPTFSYYFDITSAPAQLLHRNPSAAEIAALTAGATYTNAGFPLASTQVIFDGRTTNIATTIVDGLNLSASYGAEFASGHLQVSLDGTYANSFDYQLSPETATVNRIGTVFSPQKWRNRAGMNWGKGNISVSGYWNYVDDYVDSRVPGDPRSVKDWNTFDGSLMIVGSEGGPLQDSRIVVSGTNLLDAKPPFITPGGPTPTSWDGANASVIGRFVSIELIKRW